MATTAQAHRRRAARARAAVDRPSRAARGDGRPRAGAEPRPRGGPHEGVPELRAQDPHSLRHLPGLRRQRPQGPRPDEPRPRQARAAGFPRRARAELGRPPGRPRRRRRAGDVRAATAAAPPLRAVAAPRPRRRRGAGPRGRPRGKSTPSTRRLRVPLTAVKHTGDRAQLRPGSGRVGRERDHHAGRRALLDARGRPHEAHVLLTPSSPPRVLRHSLLTSPPPRERLVIN